MSKLNSRAGMVLVMVTMIVVVMSILVVGLMSRNVSRALTVEQQIRKLESEQVATKARWSAYMACRAGNNPAAEYDEPVNTRSYHVLITGGCDMGSGYSVDVTY